MKNNSSIEIKLVKKINRDDFILLYKEAGWWKPEFSKDLSFIDSIVKNSFCFAGAFDNSKLIGIGRSLSDGVSDAYIQDVTVLISYRGQGIGSRIVYTIINHLQANGIDWICLIAEPGTEIFYKKLGFQLMKGYSPVLLGLPTTQKNAGPES